MKLTVLCDNCSRVGAYYLSESGVSYLLEDGDARILLDTGYTDVYVRNAEKLGIDLTNLTALVLSHGHDDHTGGMIHLPRQQAGKLPLYAHPNVFDRKFYQGEEIGAPYTQEAAAEIFDLHLSEGPVQLSERLWFLGAIPRVNDYENKTPVGERLVDGKWEPDFMPEDSALVYKGADGLTVISGCSHAGIQNITEYAKQVCGDERISGIIGGFHMPTVTRQTEETVRWLSKLRPKNLRPCHCTCFHARAAIHFAVPIGDTCVADVIEF
ncbi:MAG: MBL fold metallo-hydrolase [Oscillospiraceae bacterium]|nr:MBL fold metallo-hydrolase [Oscillospiraceae bacterium]